MINGVFQDNYRSFIDSVLVLFLIWMLKNFFIFQYD